MSPSPLPPRPRLADHVLVRRHFAAGREVIALHDTESGRLVALGPREWGLIEAADGTRDLAGILLAAGRDGSFAREPALRAFLEQLHAAGMLNDGPDEAPAERSAIEIPADRPLDPLEGFSLACDGRGSCCRIYASVLFSPLEAARARAARPLVLEGGERHRHVFTPERGSGACAGSAVALIDGRCAYLEADGRCSIHAAAGEASKPLGCRLFPVTFTDDGEAVRVSVAVECACVLASVSARGGAPIVPPGARTREDLGPSVFIATIPANLRLTRASSPVRRSSLILWSRVVLRAVERIEAGLPGALWALASAVELAGLDEFLAIRVLTEGGGSAVKSSIAAADAAGALPAVDAREILPWIEALHARASRRAQEDAVWRGDLDLARRATRWIEASAEALLAPGACEEALARVDPATTALEVFSFRAALHGYHLLADGLSLAASLRDRAVRFLIARSMQDVLRREVEAGVAGASDPAARYPIALVEAMLRGHGLEAYRRDIDG